MTSTYHQRCGQGGSWAITGQVPRGAGAAHAVGVGIRRGDWFGAAAGAAVLPEALSVRGRIFFLITRQKKSIK
jgi:hypothetical protein